MFALTASLAAIAIPSFFTDETSSSNDHRKLGGCAAFLLDRYGSEIPRDRPAFEMREVGGHTVVSTYVSKTIRGLCERKGDKTIFTEAACSGPTDLQLVANQADNTEIMKTFGDGVESMGIKTKTVIDCPLALASVLGAESLLIP